MKPIIIIILLLVVLKVNAQITNTTNIVGLLYSEPDNVSAGFLLFSPLYSPNTYLIDNCGLVVNSWIFKKYLPYSGCYLLEDGSLIKLTKTYGYGAETCIEQRSWDDDLIWEYCIDANIGDFHSDLHILLNGNVLVLMLENFTIEEAILSGVNPAFLDDKYCLESIVELQPNGTNDAKIVWKWRMKDHLIQDYDASKSNYGVVANHPRKYDAN